MTLTLAGQYGPEALINRTTGDPLPSATAVSAPDGYTATFVDGNMTVIGAPGPVVARITPPGATAYDVTVIIPPAVEELAEGPRPGRPLGAAIGRSAAVQG